MANSDYMTDIPYVVSDSAPVAPTSGTGAGSGRTFSQRTHDIGLPEVLSDTARDLIITGNPHAKAIDPELLIKLGHSGGIGALAYKYSN